jgi:hypothetical protein
VATRDGLDELPVPGETYLGTLDALVGLIEERPGDRTGHSASVARLCARICEKLELASAQTQSVVIAAYLHDLGVSPASHVTAFEVARGRHGRRKARETSLVPLRLLGAASLPQPVIDAIRHRCERFDRRGIPKGLVGHELPLGARILGVAESYVDLTDGKRGPSGPKCAPDDACDALAEHAGGAFDPAIIECLRAIVAEEGHETRTTAPRKAIARDRSGRSWGRGVKGSLQEMALTDVIQVLANGRKNGRLEVRSGALHGELRFQQGSIHDARFGRLEGAEAVYGILRLTEGEFALETETGYVDDLIGIPTHHLLLEAMRRMDEERR